MKLESPRKVLRHLRTIGTRLSNQHPVDWSRPGSIDEKALLTNSLDNQSHTSADVPYAISNNYIAGDSFHDLTLRPEIENFSNNNRYNERRHFDTTPQRLSAITVGGGDDLKYDLLRRQTSVEAVHRENRLNELNEIVGSPNSLFASIDNATLGSSISSPTTRNSSSNHEKQQPQQPYLKLIRETISDTLGKFAATDCAKCLTGEDARIVTDPAHNPDAAAQQRREATGASRGAFQRLEGGARRRVSQGSSKALATADDANATDCLPLLQESISPLSESAKSYSQRSFGVSSNNAQSRKRGKAAVKGTTSSVEDETLGDSSCFYGCSPFFKKEKRFRNSSSPRLEAMCGPGSNECGDGRAVHPAACCTWELRRAKMRTHTSERLESTRVEEMDDALGLDQLPEFAPPHAVPVLEMSERGMSGGSGGGVGQPKIYQAYKGQLRLTIKVNYGLLTVHVEQARHLCSSRKPTCDSFVKMSLMPGQTRRTRSATEVVPDTNHPVYDQRFSYELVPSDAGRRLCIAVYHRDARTRTNQMLGSMSFGVHDVTNNAVIADGWYYLLSDHLGSSKHLRATDQPCMPPPLTTHNHPSSQLPDNELSAILPQSPLPPRKMQHREEDQRVPALKHMANKMADGETSGSEDTDSGAPASPASSAEDGSQRAYVHLVPITAPQIITLPIVRGTHGYGLSINGTGPAYISRVEEGSPADRVGFEAGDVVLRVNNQPVHHMAFDQVARVIRYYRRCIVLEVLRTPASSEAYTQTTATTQSRIQPLNHPTTPNHRYHHLHQTYRTTPLQTRTHLYGDSLDSSIDSLDSEDECYESGIGSDYVYRVVEQHGEMGRREVHGHSQGSEYGYLDVPAYPQYPRVGNDSGATRRAPYEVPMRQRCGNSGASMDASSHSMSSRKETTI